MFNHILIYLQSVPSGLLTAIIQFFVKINKLKKLFLGHIFCRVVEVH